MTERKMNPVPALFDSPEQQRLIMAMIDGRLPRCRPDEAHDDDAEVRYTVATVKCPRCPLLDECRAAGEFERWGVWGGVDRTGRRVRDLPRRRGEPR